METATNAQLKQEAQAETGILLDRLAATLKIKGISEEVLECQKCGKPELKRTIILSDGQSEMFYGSQCAANALGMRRKSDVERIAEGHKRQPKLAVYRGGRLLGYR